MTTFSPPHAPAPGDVEFEPRILGGDFGDGYTTRAPDGINGLRRVYSNVVWQAISTADKATIVGFFEARGGYLSFDWTAPDDDTSRKYICRKWSVHRVADNAWNVSAVIRQEFDLA